MNGKSIVSVLNVIFIWITRLAVVNILWILFSLLGLLIAGIFPATVALLGVSRKWVLGEHDFKVLDVFAKIYRKEFVKANMLGLLFVIMGCLLYVNHLTLLKNHNDILFLVPFAFYFLVFFYIIASIWVLPLLAHYENKLFLYIKSAIVIGLAKIHYTCAIGLIMIAITYFSLNFPGLLPFFTFGVSSTIIMWISMKVFKQLEINNTQSL